MTSAPGTEAERKHTVTVVGLGKVGLPLAVQFADAGWQVVGADVQADVVALVGRGEEPFPGEHDLDRRLADVVARGRLTATTDTTEAVARSAVVVVIVPLIVDASARPDFTIVDAATAAIAAGVRPGTLVSYETTLPVGTTRTRLAPALAAGSGLGLGRELFVAMSPERVLTGRVFRDLAAYPKLVGGLDAECTRRAEAFYRSVLTFDDRPDLHRPNGVWAVGNTDAAELVKLAETTYRDVNIALANTFAVHAESLGIDYDVVTQAANSQPYSHLHATGVAVGGHCIPVYPQLYLAGDPQARLVQTAREVNLGMPSHVVAQLAAALDAQGLGLAGSAVVVMGAAYRGGVKETAFSGVFPLVELLHERGAVVTVHDPLFSDHELAAHGLLAHHLGDACQGAIVQADHVQYAVLSKDDLPGVRAIVDGRGITSDLGWAGVARIVLGAPSKSTINLRTGG